MRGVKRGQEGSERKQDSTNLGQNAGLKKRAKPGANPAPAQFTEAAAKALVEEETIPNSRLAGCKRGAFFPVAEPKSEFAGRSPAASPPSASPADDEELAGLFGELDVDGESSALGQFKEEREAEAAVSSRASCSIVSGGDGRRTNQNRMLESGFFLPVTTEDASDCKPEPSDHEKEKCSGLASPRHR